ncbi:MAG: fumarylacetoacetate hydrolase family protein, partial [Proteobacteria bacterium]|nr:fumarylacetoacetate hydrolase family protein [Pseudomonadota bacterium]
MAVRLANAQGRAVLVIGDAVADVERASNGRFGADPMAALRDWDAFASWASGVGAGVATGALDESALGPPVPRPAKVFAIGLNYKSHAQEAGLPLPGKPMVFTKFQNCLSGPRADVRLSSDFVDWEVELVVVIGRRGKAIS